MQRGQCRLKFSVGNRTRYFIMRGSLEITRTVPSTFIFLNSGKIEQNTKQARQLFVNKRNSLILLIFFKFKFLFENLSLYPVNFFWLN